MDETGQWKETIFCVNKKPWLIADPDLRRKNLEFLNGIDAEYFKYCLETHGKAKESEWQHASIAMQSTLHHALETLFSLIGVLVQAHDCGYAWIAKCETRELINFVQRISDEDDSLFTKLPGLVISWGGIATAIGELCQLEPSLGNSRQYAATYGTCLTNLACEITDGNNRDEYNSIKHGFRIQAGGGYKLWMRMYDDTMPTPQKVSDEMALITESDHGASFFKLVPLSESRKERGLKALRIHANWNPTRTMMLIEIAYAFIVNVVHALKRINGVQEQLVSISFPEPGELEKPWQLPRSFMKVSTDHSLMHGPMVTEEKLNNRINYMQGIREVK
jgi:hypothetical protein